MSTFAPALAQLAIDCESEGLTVKNSEKIAVELAKFFNVHQDEIGILRLDKESLLFVHPAQLHNVGRIPLNSSASLAVRTANSKRPEIVNNFARTRHSSFFEMVDLGGKSKEPGKKATKEEQIIQKIMSVPVISMNQVMGVIQVCRKGPTAPAAGLDFSPADLQKLANIASALAKCFIK
ncbi:MAG TPA: GAF domain-containing protein [Candidatus Angelobacter sp.]|jgi:transcriptional regulator with GAF, ATPase, and Fis domain|nr:GAF domain-containing protein [Candidatus Angelobacter sp.]